MSDDEYVTNETSENEDEEDDDLIEDDGMCDGGVPENLKPVWQYAKIHGYTNELEEKKWDCIHCGKSFTTWNCTKAVNPVTKTKQGQITPCSGNIPEKWFRRYAAIKPKSKQTANKADRTRARDEVVLHTHERGLEIVAVIKQRNSTHWGDASDGTSHHDAIDLINSPVINIVVVSNRLSMTVPQDCLLVLTLVLLQRRQRLGTKQTLF